MPTDVPRERWQDMTPEEWDAAATSYRADTRSPDAVPQHSHQSFASRNACPECRAAMAAARSPDAVEAAWEALKTDPRMDIQRSRAFEHHRPLIEAALAARSAPLEERLARAMHVALGKHVDHTGPVCAACHEDAVDAAREYAALRSRP